jgi:two-component system, NarL family, response regulator NreC
MPISVMLVDDSALARRLIRNLIAGLVEGGTCIEATNGQEAVDKAKTDHPDIVIMDIVMPALNGVDAAEEIIATSPRTAVLAISTYDPKPILERLLGSGVHGFIAKSAMATDLVPAVTALLAGKTYFPPGIKLPVAKSSRPNARTAGSAS